MTDEIKKVYWTTGEVAEMLGVSLVTVHKRLTFPVKRRGRGYRRITAKQIEVIKRQKAA